MLSETVTGVVLAGGKSSRMGTDKGMLPFNGIPLAERQLQQLKPVCKHRMIVANKKSYEQFGVPVFSDIIENCGPMGGIYTALLHAPTDKILVLACDMPFISVSFLVRLLSQAQQSQVAVPVFRNLAEPLCAIYSRSCAERFALLLQQGEYGMRDALNYFSVTGLQIEDDQDKEIFFNMNTPDDLKHHSKNKVK